MEVKCALCNQVFNSFRSLKSHINFNHNSVNTYSCASPGCFRSYSLFSSYRRHYMASHDTSQNFDSIESPITQTSTSATYPEIHNDVPTNSDTLENDENQEISNTKPTVNVSLFHKILAKLGSKLYALCIIFLRRLCSM